MAMRKSKAPAKADTLSPGPLVFRQALGGDGEEDEIVDAEDDFEEGEGDQADPAVYGKYPRIPHGPVDVCQPLGHSSWCPSAVRPTQNIATLVT